MRSVFRGGKNRARRCLILALSLCLALCGCAGRQPLSVQVSGKLDAGGTRGFADWKQSPPEDVLALLRCTYVLEGSRWAVVNGVWVDLIEPPYRAQGKLMVPARNFVDKLGGQIVGGNGTYSVQRGVDHQWAVELDKTAPIAVSAAEVALAMGMRLMTFENDEALGPRGAMLCPPDIGGAALDFSGAEVRATAAALLAQLGIELQFSLTESNVPALDPSWVAYADKFCDPQGGTDALALLGGGQRDLALLTSEGLTAESLNAGQGTDAFAAWDAQVAKDTARAVVATRALADGSSLLVIAFHGGLGADEWVREALNSSGGINGAYRRQAEALLGAREKISFHELSKRMGRAMTLDSALEEAGKSNSELRILLTGYGQAGGAAQAFLELLFRRGVLPSNVLGITWAPPMVFGSGLIPDRGDVGMYNLVRREDVFCRFGGKNRIGFDCPLTEDAGAGSAPLSPALSDASEAVIVAQELLALEDSDRALALALRLSGGPEADAFTPLLRVQIAEWARQGLPQLLALRSGPRAAQRQVAQKLLSGELVLGGEEHGQDAYRQAYARFSGEVVPLRDVFNWTDAQGAGIRLLDTLSAVQGLYGLTGINAANLDRDGILRYHGLSVRMRKFGTEQRTTELWLTDASREGPRALHTGSEQDDVLAAFPASENLAGDGLTILYRANPGDDPDDIRAPSGALAVTAGTDPQGEEDRKGETGREQAAKTTATYQYQGAMPPVENAPPEVAEWLSGRVLMLEIVIEEEEVVSLHLFTQSYE